MWREIEADKGYDDTFKTAVPFDSPANQAAPGAEVPAEPPAVSGVRGGRPTGGGDSKQSPQGALD
jgi:hypothetical protein